MVIRFATGGSVLRGYRLYRLDGAGKIMSAEWIEADSDADALREARKQVDGVRYELWARDRLVERSHPTAE
jgi:hypothetical protein